ncbi:hypothetical protein [Priestia megaterium]
MKARDIKNHLDELAETITKLEQENTSTSITKETKEYNEHMIKTFTYQIKSYQRKLRLAEVGYYEKLERQWKEAEKKHYEAILSPLTFRSMLAE